MLEIYPKMLWLGNAQAIRDPRRLFDAGVQCVVDVAFEEKPAQLPREIVYCRFPLNDGGGNELKLLFRAVQVTVDLVRDEMRTIVGCSAGLSPSPTIAAFTLATILAITPEEAIARIADSKRLAVHPVFWQDVSSACSRC